MQIIQVLKLLEQIITRAVRGQGGTVSDRQRAGLDGMVGRKEGVGWKQQQQCQLLGCLEREAQPQEQRRLRGRARPFPRALVGLQWPEVAAVGAHLGQVRAIPPCAHLSTPHHPADSGQLCWNCSNCSLFSPALATSALSGLFCRAEEGTS